MTDCLVVLVLFVEKTILFALNGLGTLVEKSFDHRHMGLFPDSQFYSIDVYVKITVLVITAL